MSTPAPSAPDNEYNRRLVVQYSRKQVSIAPLHESENARRKRTAVVTAEMSLFADAKVHVNTV